MVHKSIILTVFTAAILFFAAVDGHGKNHEVSGRSRIMSERIQSICIKKSRATREDLLQVGVHGFPDDVAENSKCYFVCLMEQFGMVGHGGELSYDRFSRIMTDEHRTAIDTVKKVCTTYNSRAKDRCGEAYNLHRCYYDNSPELSAMLLPREMKHGGKENMVL